MKRSFAFCLLGFCALSSGCGLLCNAAHNLAAETHREMDELEAFRRNRQWARSAWDAARGADPSRGYSPDYADGFKDGFADYLAAGGTGEPPAVPPRKYWKASYGTPQGYQAIEDWFTGFRHGAAVARDGGYRRWVVLPYPFAGISNSPSATLQPEEAPMPNRLPEPRADEKGGENPNSIPTLPEVVPVPTPETVPSPPPPEGPPSEVLPEKSGAVPVVPPGAGAVVPVSLQFCPPGRKGATDQSPRVVRIPIGPLSTTPGGLIQPGSYVTPGN